MNLRTKALWALVDQHGNIIEADPSRFNMTADDLDGERIVRITTALARKPAKRARAKKSIKRLPSPSEAK